MRISLDYEVECHPNLAFVTSDFDRTRRVVRMNGGGGSGGGGALELSKVELLKNSVLKDKESNGVVAIELYERGD